MRAVIRYPGSKWGMANWIISHFPTDYEKMVYLEPFAGSGAVFFNKRPGAVETINDLDGDVVNLFRVLREQPDELKRALDLTPYSREEYDLSFEACDDPRWPTEMPGKCGRAAAILPDFQSDLGG